jgi:oligoendopeptidase F
MDKKEIEKKLRNKLDELENLNKKLTEFKSTLQDRLQSGEITPDEVDKEVTLIEEEFAKLKKEMDELIELAKKEGLEL